MDEPWSPSLTHMLSFRLFNIPVHVHPFFWITLGLIGGGLSAQSSEEVLYVLMFVLAGFLSILVHELGHALTIRKYGLATEVHLVAFGGFASYAAGRLDRRQSFLVTAAGPGIQIILGILALVLLEFMPLPAGSLMGYLLSSLVLVSIFWAVLNCLPIHPLDGGQMLAAVLGPQRRRSVHLIGILTALSIGLLGFVLLNGALLLLIFMGYFAYQNWQAYSQAG